jgi:hypothetical protein
VNGYKTLHERSGIYQHLIHGMPDDGYIIGTLDLRHYRHGKTSAWLVFPSAKPADIHRNHHKTITLCLLQIIAGKSDSGDALHLNDRNGLLVISYANYSLFDLNCLLFA